VFVSFRVALCVLRAQLRDCDSQSTFAPEALNPFGSREVDYLFKSERNNAANSQQKRK
jgi:hypothetical protein